jgi:hypothetical protein
MAGLPGKGLNFLENTALGVKALETLASREALEVVMAAFVGGIPAAEAIGHRDFLGKVSSEVSDLIMQFIGEAERDIGAPLLKTVLAGGLGIELSDTSGQARDAVRMIERAMGFAAGLPAVVGPIAGFLDTKFGTHAPKGLTNALRELPHEMGLSFFLGTTLASIFETATMQPLREAINVQVHPARLELMMIVRLLKQRRISEVDARDALDKAGLRPEDIERLLVLDDIFLTPSELGEAWITGRMSDDELTGNLSGIGYDDRAQGLLRSQWIETSQAEGAAMLKGIMRSAFIDNHVTEGQLVATLQGLNVPAPAITLEIEALKLQKDFSVTKESTATIKALFQKGEITDAEAIQRLVENGNSAATAQDFITVWVDESVKKKPVIGQATILRFLHTGVINAERALQMFTDNGVSAETSMLLIQSQGILDGVVKHELNEAAYVAAYQADVISVDELRAGLAALQLPATRIDLVTRTEVNKKNRRNKVKAPVKALSEGDVRKAVHYGTALPSWGIRELVTLGYTEQDAELIVVTEIMEYIQATHPVIGPDGTPVPQALPLSWLPLA